MTFNLDKAVIASLDAKELFKFGVRASQEGDSAAALAYLKEAVTRDSAHPEAHWLLAAEYASLGLPDRALPEFALAIELKPELHTARFQLGLLHLTMGRLVESEEVWQELDQLDGDHPLRQFRDGLTCMARDDLRGAVTPIRAALSQQGLDAALRRDMEMVLKELEGRLDMAPADSDPVTAQEESSEAQLAMSAYARGITH